MEAPQAALPETRALAALMCLHAARLPGRIDESGDLHPLVEQDRVRWNGELLERGFRLLEQSAAGPAVSAYHVEAAIAAAHATARTPADTDWVQIVGLYDRLMTLAPSPVVALNRAIAIGQRDGAERGLDALHAIAGVERLER